MEQGDKTGVQRGGIREEEEEGGGYYRECAETSSGRSSSRRSPLRIYIYIYFNFTYPAHVSPLNSNIVRSACPFLRDGTRATEIIRPLLAACARVPRLSLFLFPPQSPRKCTQRRHGGLDKIGAGEFGKKQPSRYAPLRITGAPKERERERENTCARAL